MPSQRRPLQTVSPNIRVKSLELSPYQRGRIVGAFLGGQSKRSLARDYHVSDSTIRDTIQKDPQRQQGESLPRKGRPTVTTDRDKRSLLRKIKSDPNITYNSLQISHPLEISRGTIYNIAKEAGIKRWLAKGRPLLTQKDADIRDQWCLARRNFDEDYFCEYIFSDECSLERGAGGKRPWKWRTGPQKCDKNMVDPYPKGKQLSQMIWGCFSGVLGRSELVIMTRDSDAPRGGYSARSYIKTLEEGLRDFYKDGFIFMHDNASIHTAYVVRAWLERHGVWVDDWPPHSPDLNPIEHLWAFLKDKIDELYPHLKSISGKSEADLEHLQECILHAWDAIPREKIDSLWKSMPARIRHVLRRKGGIRNIRLIT